MPRLSDVDDAGVVRVQRSRSVDGYARRRSVGMGIAMVLVGSVLAGYVAWQYWGTTWVSERRQQQVLETVTRQWDEGEIGAIVEEGDVRAVVRVPRFGPDFEVPLLEGTGPDALAAGLGHVEHTAAPGSRGNVVLAGHRVTHGEPLRDMPDLVPGDEVVIETRDRIYTYVLDTGGDDLSVSFDQTWVLDRRPSNPQPDGPGPLGGAGKRLITLTTCAELFHTDQRLVAFGHLVSVEPAGR